MANFSHYPLQKAIYQKLTGDAGLQNLISGVFDRPPQGQAYPYITIGQAVINDWSTKTTIGSEQRLDIHIWSREGGKKQVETIAEKIHSLLHLVDMSVDGQTLVMMRFMSSSILPENDGYTYHGTMRFRALLEAN